MTNWDKTKIRNVLNILFIIGAVVTIILYFAVDNPKPFYYACGFSLVVKMAEVVMRMIRYK